MSLAELDRLLALHQGSEKQYTIDFNQVDLLTENDIINFRNELITGSGIVVIENATSPEEIKMIRQEIGKTVNKMYNVESSSLQESLKIGKGFEELSHTRSLKNGWGFPHFGSLYWSPLVNPIKQTIEGTSTYFTYLPSYHDVNMLAMKSNPKRTHLQIRLSHETGQAKMLSWNACKFVEGSGFKTNRTSEHIDWYDDMNSDEIDIARIQVVMNDDNANTKLCFVPYSWTPKILKIIAELENNPKLFVNHGFKMIKNKDTVRILRKHAIIPKPKSMVLWRSGVTHFEGTVDNKTGGLVQSEINQSTDSRLRLMLGTHCPIKTNGESFSDETLKRLAVYASMGICPEYNNKANKDSVVFPNIVCTKYGNPVQKLSNTQMKFFESVLSLTDLEISQKFNQLSNIEQELSGISTK
jgi:hypothetical protein